MTSTAARTTVLWFRRDLRLADHPALLAALEAADEVVPLFVLDSRLQQTSGPPRLAFLHGCLAELHEGTGRHLVIRSGDPVDVVPAVADEVGAEAVFVSDDFGPYGRQRDQAVSDALAAAGRSLRRRGSPYAIEPGALRTGSGTPFKVFTPFFRAWSGRRKGTPADAPAVPRWAKGVSSEAVPARPDLAGTTILRPGETAARERLRFFVDTLVAGYDEGRNVPGGDATSRLSVYLKYGCIHPRQALAELGNGNGNGNGAERFRTELAWREFYADVLFAHPESSTVDLRDDMAGLRSDHGPEADRRFEAWAEGRTGFPIVDAGMRQLKAEAWMHNRVRMITASFLVKDLHLPWQRGAKLFMQRLQDGDLASNHHGWQWVAGTGTDPAPYFRVFNPVVQGEKFDADGAYITHYVPELVGLAGKALHEPWTVPGGPPDGYPPPIVDHAQERKEALARYETRTG